MLVFHIIFLLLYFGLHRFTKDIAASEGPESIDWFEVLSAIIAPLEQDEASKYHRMNVYYLAESVRGQVEANHAF